MPDIYDIKKLNPVTFVSLGPGDAELITVKGLRILKQADIVFCPSTNTFKGNTVSRSKEILLELGVNEAKITMFNVPMNKDRLQAIKCYEDVASEVEKCYEKGYKTVIVAEGDAGFYSTIHYICDNLTLNKIPTERIAGIPAFIACGALANIHIAKQEEELVVIPGIITSEDLKKKIDARKPIVIMKPSQSEAALKQAIVMTENAGIHYFENVGVEEKEFYTQNKTEIIRRKFPYFSLLIIV